MKLRTQLIVAFLLLAVVPLFGVTLYSYASSIRAHRGAVAAEAATLAHDMGARMELVTADLEERVNRLQTLPYNTLIDDSAANTEAGDFVAKLRVEMGEAAGLLRSLEYIPWGVTAPASPHAPQPPGQPQGVSAPSAPTEPESVVIHLSQGLFGDTTVVTPTPDGASVLHTGREVLVLPQRWLPRHAPKSEMVRIATALRRSGLREGWTRAMERIAEESVEWELAEVERGQLDPELAKHRLEAWIKVAAERIETAAAEIQEKSREAQAAGAAGDGPSWIAMVNMATEIATQDLNIEIPDLEHLNELGELSNLEGLEELEVAVQFNDFETKPERMTPFEFGREFSCAVEQDGQTVGQVRARLDIPEVLDSVLSRRRSDQGEIAFAISADGEIYSPRPEDQDLLNGLGLSTRVVDGAIEIDVADKDWIVVSRDVPSLGLSFGIARPVGDALVEIRRTAGRNMSWGLGLVGLAMLGMIPLSGRMTRNLGRLTEGASQLAQGDLTARVPVRSKDEIGELARVFNRMGESLEENQRQLVTQERLKKELEMCRQIQDELLPTGTQRFSCADVRAVSLPAREVGGDFFNYFTLPNGDVAVLMGDVSGKGIPAALLMANLQATLRARLPFDQALGTLMADLDRELEASTPPESYVTLFVAVIEASARSIRFVNAGHNIQYVVTRRGEVKRLDPGGRPLGLLSGGGYDEGRVDVAAGDLLFLFTDGLIEAENPQRQAYGPERLEQLLIGCRGSDPGDVLAQVEQSVTDFRASAEPVDDATLLVLRVNPPTS